MHCNSGGNLNQIKDYTIEDGKGKGKVKKKMEIAGR
jgi:hypothetical protein